MEKTRGTVPGFLLFPLYFPLGVDSGWGLGQISGLAGAAGGWPIPIWRRIRMELGLALTLI